jgi:hypothetical protein
LTEVPLITPKVAAEVIVGISELRVIEDIEKLGSKLPGGVCSWPT